MTFRVTQFTGQTPVRQRALLREAFKASTSMREAAERLGLSRTYMYAMMKKLGVKTSKRGQS